MAKSILLANLTTMGLSLAFAVLAIAIGAVTVNLVDRYLFPQLDFVEEIKKGNIAAAIVVSAMVLFMAIVLSNALR